MHEFLVDLEAVAEELRQRAHLPPDGYALATDVAAAEVGEENLIVDPELAGSAYVRSVDDVIQIVLRLDAPDLRFRLMHETAHARFRRLNMQFKDPAQEERAANYVAAAVIAPRELLLRAHRYYGERPQRLAKIFGLSATAMTLRLSEVLGDERAVVTRKNNNVLKRGQVWAILPALEYARGETTTAALKRLGVLGSDFPGIAKTEFRDGLDAGRIALRVKRP